MSATLTRRSAIASAFVLPIATPAQRDADEASPDTDLLLFCAAFEASGERLKWFNGCVAEFDEAECNAELDRWYATLEQIAELDPRTPQGWRAKARAAWQALGSTAGGDGIPLEREEQLALDVLGGLLEAVI